MARGPGFFARGAMYGIPESERPAVWSEVLRLRRERRWQFDGVRWIYRFLVALTVVLMIYELQLVGPLSIWGRLLIFGFCVFFIMLGYGLVLAYELDRLISLAKMSVRGIDMTTGRDRRFGRKSRSSLSESDLYKLHPRVQELAPDVRAMVIDLYREHIPQSAQRDVRLRASRSGFICGGIVAWTIYQLWPKNTSTLGAVLQVPTVLLLGFLFGSVVFAWHRPLPVKTIAGTIEELGLWRTFRAAGIPCCVLCGGVQEHDEGTICTACLKARESQPAESCVGCGYDLHGLEQSVQCPECGLDRAVMKRWKKNLSLWDRVRGRV